MTCPASSISPAKQAHTPTHDRLTYFVGNANGRGLIRIEIEGTGEHVASMPRGKISEERAALIVHRVNSHDALVAALKACRAKLERVSAAARGDNGHSEHTINVLAQARAAIANAEAS